MNVKELTALVGQLEQQERDIENEQWKAGNAAKNEAEKPFYPKIHAVSHEIALAKEKLASFAKVGVGDIVYKTGRPHSGTRWVVKHVVDHMNFIAVMLKKDGTEGRTSEKFYGDHAFKMVRRVSEPAPEVEIDETEVKKVLKSAGISLSEKYSRSGAVVANEALDVLVWFTKEVYGSNSEAKEKERKEWISTQMALAESALKAVFGGVRRTTLQLGGFGRNEHEVIAVTRNQDAKK